MNRPAHQYGKPCDCDDCSPDPTDGDVIPGSCRHCASPLVCTRDGGRLAWVNRTDRRPHTCA